MQSLEANALGARQECLNKTGFALGLIQSKSVRILVELNSLINYVSQSNTTLKTRSRLLNFLMLILERDKVRPNVPPFPASASFAL
jgi:hypothetical protein